MGNATTNITIKASDKASEAIKQVAGALEKVSQQAAKTNAAVKQSVKQVGGALENVSKQAYQSTVAVGAIKQAMPALLVASTAIAGLGFTMAKTAMNYEKFLATLETTEGSAKGARDAMAWVAKFAAKTPYDIEQSTQAFIRLRAYGLDPTKGLLKTLGDTASAMGKPLMASIEMMADAITGENERLKEFGIRGSKAGGKIAYSYVNKAGEQKTKTVDGKDRKQIQQALESIFNEKYNGAMERLSKTMTGALSNIGDQWMAFSNQVMASGVYEHIGKIAQRFVDMGNSAAKSEEQAAMAAKLGAMFDSVVTAIEEIGKAIAPVVKPVLDIVMPIVEGVSLAIADIAKDFAPIFAGIGAMLAPLGGASSIIKSISYWLTQILVFGLGLVVLPESAALGIFKCFNWLGRLLSPLKVVWNLVGGWLSKMPLLAEGFAPVVKVVQSIVSWLTKALVALGLLSGGVRSANEHNAQLKAEAARDGAPYAKGVMAAKNKSFLNAVYPTLKLAGKRALGGAVSGSHPYLVGERGPELFIPSSAGRVVTNNQLAGAGNGTLEIVLSVMGGALNIVSTKQTGNLGINLTAGMGFLRV